MTQGRHAIAGALNFLLKDDRAGGGLQDNDLTGPVAVLGNLVNLQRLNLQENWGSSGPLPSGLRGAPLESLFIFLPQTCAPAAWRDWLRTIDDSNGRLCVAGVDGEARRGDGRQPHHDQARGPFPAWRLCANN